MKQGWVLFHLLLQKRKSRFCKQLLQIKFLFFSRDFFLYFVEFFFKYFSSCCHESVDDKFGLFNTLVGTEMSQQEVS